jgi:hypothetical protein
VVCVIFQRLTGGPVGLLYGLFVSEQREASVVNSTCQAGGATRSQPCPNHVMCFRSVSACCMADVCTLYECSDM